MASFRDSKKSVLDPVQRKNQLFRLNKFVGQKPVIAIFILALDLFLFFLINSAIKLISQIPDWITCLRTGTEIQMAFFGIVSWQAAVIVAVGLLILDIYIYYKFRIAFGDINIGLKGSARFATIKELKRQYVRVRSDDTPIKGPGGFPVAQVSYLTKFNGKLTKPWKKRKNANGEDVFMIYIDRSPINVLIIGITRSGKGEIDVFLLIDLYSRSKKMKDRASFVITDPKLELAPMCYETLLKRGYKVHILNLTDLEYSCGYNPLHLIVETYKEGNKALAETLCNSLSYSIYKADNQGSGGSNEKFFDDNSTAALTATILGLIDDCLKLDEENNKRRKKHFKRARKTFLNLDPDTQRKARIYQFVDSQSDTERDYQKYVTWAHDASALVGAEVTPQQIAAYDRILNLYHRYERKEMTVAEIAESGLLYYRTEREVNNALNFCWFCLHLQVDDEFVETHDFEKCINMYSVQLFFTSLARISRSSNGSVTELDLYFQSRKQEDGLPDRAATNYAAIEVSMDRTKSSIFSSMLTSLRIFTMENVARMTVENTIDIKSIGFGDQPVAVFLGVPDFDHSLDFLASFFIGQVSYVLAEASVKSEANKCDRLVSFILDEIGNFPRIHNLSKYVSVGLSRGLRYYLIIQGLSQLYEKYGDNDATTIIENCSTWQYLLTENVDTVNKISSRLGNETVTEVTRSGPKYSLNKTYTEQSTSKPLLYPDELLILTPGENVVLRSTSRTTLLGNHVRPRPIYNTSDPDYDYLGTERFRHRYEFMDDRFPNSRRGFATIQKQVENRTHIKLKDYVFPMNVYFNRKAQREWGEVKLINTTFDKFVTRFTAVLDLQAADLMKLQVKDLRAILEDQYDNEKIKKSDYLLLTKILERTITLRQ